MYSLDEEKINVCLATGIYGFWQGKEADNVYLFLFFYVGIRGIYLSLTLGTAKFKQLD